MFNCISEISTLSLHESFYALLIILLNILLFKHRYSIEHDGTQVKLLSHMVNPLNGIYLLTLIYVWIHKQLFILIHWPWLFLFKLLQLFEQNYAIYVSALSVLHKDIIIFKYRQQLHKKPQKLLKYGCCPPSEGPSRSIFYWNELKPMKKV